MPLAGADVSALTVDTIWKTDLDEIPQVRQDEQHLRWWQQTRELNSAPLSSTEGLHVSEVAEDLKTLSKKGC